MAVRCRPVAAGSRPRLLLARCVRRSTSFGVATGISPRVLLDPRSSERETVSDAILAATLLASGSKR
jgi:hypothetical protein